MYDPSTIFRIILIGIGATITTDLWALALRWVLGIPSLDYALVGRWVGHMRFGRWTHNPIGAAAPVKGERAAGWALHYAIGIVFALVFAMVVGQSWVQSPTILPAAIFGLLTVSVPFFIMQPAFGMGIAASRTPKPMITRLKSVLTHLIFGFGLWLSAVILA